MATLKGRSAPKPAGDMHCREVGETHLLLRHVVSARRTVRVRSCSPKLMPVMDMPL
jgi:hypothetical protein